MGLEIVLQAEIGTQVDGVADTRNFLEKLLPQIDDEEYPILGGIDHCGDTIFNGIQMRRFLLEWVAVSAKVTTAEERELVSRIEQLARRCHNDIRLYVRFVGGLSDPLAPSDGVTAETRASTVENPMDGTTQCFVSER